MIKTMKIGLMVAALCSANTFAAKITSYMGTGAGPIPDNDPTGIEITFAVPALVDISNIQIAFDISHTWVGDLEITLTAADANSHTIFKRTGRVGANNGDSSDLSGLYAFSDIMPTNANWWDAASAVGPSSNVPNGFYRATTAWDAPTGGGVDTAITSAFNNTMPAGNWVLTVSDNGLNDDGVINAAALTITAGPPNQLTSSFAALSGDRGFFFDITAKTKPVSVQRFDINLRGAAMVTMYSKAGSYVGSENNAGAWKPIGSMNVSGVPQVPTPFDVRDVLIPAGQTVGFFISAPAPATIEYFGAGDSETKFYENNEIEVSTGAGIAGLFSGPALSPRGWSGTVYYGDEEEGCYVVKAANNNTVAFCL